MFTIRRSDIELEVKKEALRHFSDIWETYKDISSRLRSPAARKALGKIKVETKEGEEVTASKATSALPSTEEVFISNIRKKIKRRRETGYKGEFQKEVEPRLQQLSKKSGISYEELEELFFETAGLWLKGLEQLGDKTVKKLLDAYDPEELVGISKEDLESIKGIGEKRAEKILKDLPV